MRVEVLDFAGNGAQLNGLLAQPEQAAQAACVLPSVLLIHEWWGLDDCVKHYADALVKEDFVVFAPNLYARQQVRATQDLAEASQWMSRLSTQTAHYDLNDAIQYMRQVPAVDAQRIGAIGFGMGASLALNMATQNSDLKAVVAYNGKMLPITSVNAMVAPVLYHHGVKGTWATVQDANFLKQGLNQYGKPGAVYSYAQAGHGFYDATRPQEHVQADATLAWQRSLAFLRQYLQ